MELLEDHLCKKREGRLAYGGGGGGGWGKGGGERKIISLRKIIPF